ncbi:hypothetical protein CHS0354_012281 [Potamilus streckersoni]|uniref:Uncharacterized protein n=1 Tax=Potamilus streckersoni TaxID=2493646 RepID=A0AAE0SYW3_9BIVA|nr:hypothetical protein CHS0354_012281 [Potamilus streckersoni]
MKRGESQMGNDSGYDSWFYYKGLAQGIKTWEARPDVFPDGFPARDTTYAKQNGGMYNFLLEELKGLPLDEVFWRDLFMNATKWGLILYEQDWLNVEFRGVPSLLNNVHMGRQWLMLMGAGAKATNIRIQYCMANPRHAMQALEIPVVTQARVSDDYGPGADQWRIGISSMFAHAIGLAPYKDTFWTTELQSGNPYGINRKEPYAALNAVVSTLSTGPVGPSDKIGATDVTMLMRCCNRDGLILKPSRPLMAIDQQLIKAAFPSFSGVDGEVWTTFSEISGLKFGILLAADIKNTVPMIILPHDTGIFRVNKSVGQYVAFPYDNANRWKQFTDTDGLVISNNCTKTNFCLYHLTPQLPNSAYVLGELDKWVPISPQRVSEIEVTTDDVHVKMMGVPGEAFDFWYIYKNETYTAKCLINPEGSAVFIMRYGTCG